MLQVMATMARKCSRARYYSPEELREEYVRAVFESCDFGNTEEVTTLYYIAKGLVKGRRAADELFLEWGDVDRVDATASTSAGQVRQRPHMHMHMCHQAGGDECDDLGASLLLGKEQPGRALQESSSK